MASCKITLAAEGQSCASAPGQGIAAASILPPSHRVAARQNAVDHGRDGLVYLVLAIVSSIVGMRGCRILQ